MTLSLERLERRSSSFREETKVWPATVAGELQCNIPRHQGLGSADEQGGTPRLCL